MIGKIGLEEHFAIEETLQDSAGFVLGSLGVVRRNNVAELKSP